MPKITQHFVDSLIPDPHKSLVYWDSELKEFGVFISSQGQRTYFLDHRNKAYETQRLKIERHGSITTAEARAQAIKFILQIEESKNSSINDISDDTVHIMSELGEKYLELHANLNKTSQSYKEDFSIVHTIILKRFLNMSVDSISTLDLQKLHSDLRETPYRANRVHAVLSEMFNLAIEWGWRSDNPMEGIQKYQENKRVQWLNDAEIQKLFSVLETYQNQTVANIIRLLLLTGSRYQEVVKATWEQFDLEKGVWAKPSASTKRRTVEYLPLSSIAFELLKGMKSEAKSNFLFPGKIPGQPLKDIKKSWYAIKERAGLKDVHLRDLRNTYASHLIFSGLSISIVRKLLGYKDLFQRLVPWTDTPLRQATEIFGRKIEKLTTKA